MNHEDVTAEDISIALGKAIDYGTRGKQVTEGTVQSVDLTAYTCVIKTSSGTYTGVPLMVLKNSKASVIQIPANNSDCLLLFRDGSDQRPQLLSVDTCVEFDITIGSSALKVTSGLFQFNGGNNGPMVLINALVSQLNALQNAYNAHTHILTLSSGTGTAAPTVSQVTPTVESDIANNNITQ